MQTQKPQDPKSNFFRIDAHWPVFVSSVIVVLVLLVVTLSVGEPVKNWFADAQLVISDHVGWFFMLLVNFVFVFVLYLAFGKFGHIRIGGAAAQPDFGRWGWFSMLFSAGMGIGMLFWGVAEPINHFQHHPLTDATANPVEAAQNAMVVTYLHWGLHGWGMYALLGVALAYFTFNKKLPLSVRSIFYPLLGERIYGAAGNLVDTVAVLATLFGLATSLGLGVQQVNAGLNFLFGVGNSTGIQVLLIAFITLLATVSLLLGLKKGIRSLSLVNMWLAVFMLLFVLLIGPSQFLLDAFVENLGLYLRDFVPMSLWSNSYAGVQQSSDWHANWTIFYWAWWISWSPFVGIFIARISKGRTIRELVVGVLVFPSLFTFLWLTVFGGSALHQELLGNSRISEAVNLNFATAIYELLAAYPFSTFSSMLTVLLVTSFFVTSSDSGSFVVDAITSGGKLDTSSGQKIFWAAIEGAVAAVLLLGGGLRALQTASLLTGLPFAFILLLSCFSLHKALKDDIFLRTRK